MLYPKPEKGYCNQSLNHDASLIFFMTFLFLCDFNCLDPSPSPQYETPLKWSHELIRWRLAAWLAAPGGEPAWETCRCTRRHDMFLPIDTQTHTHTHTHQWTIRVSCDKTTLLLGYALLSTRMVQAILLASCEFQHQWISTPVKCCVPIIGPSRQLHPFVVQVAVDRSFLQSKWRGGIWVWWMSSQKVIVIQ